MNTTAQGTATLGPTVTVPSEAVPGKKPPKKRVRNFTADDRAAHRIFEKGRREAFKERLIELAGQLPALADADPQRLSKHVVVDESIARHKLLENRCVGALRGIQSLIQERDELLAEVNDWRSSNGAGLRQPRPIVINVDGLLETEKDAQRRASTVRLSQTTRRSSEQSGGPSDEAFQAVGPTDWDQPGETSRIPRVLPSEPMQDVSAPSELDGLLLDSSWPQVTQDQPITFPAEPEAMEALAFPGQQSSTQSDGHSGAVSVSTSDVDNYPLLENINSQQDSYRNVHSMEYSAANMTFETSHIPPSPSYLSSAVIQQQGIPFQPQQPWVSWPG